jgi:hypothetical protein
MVHNGGPEEGALEEKNTIVEGLPLMRKAIPKMTNAPYIK